MSLLGYSRPSSSPLRRTSFIAVSSARRSTTTRKGISGLKALFSKNTDAATVLKPSRLSTVTRQRNDVFARRTMTTRTSVAALSAPANSASGSRHGHHHDHFRYMFPSLMALTASVVLATAGVTATQAQEASFVNSLFGMGGSSTSSNDAAEQAIFSGRRMYDISVRAIRGERVYMEDEYFVADGGRFAAIFDGHGGSGVSLMLKKRLYELVTQELRKYQEENESDDNEKEGKQISSSAAAAAVPSVANYAAALRSAFERIGQEVLENDSLQDQGSTAVAVLLVESNDEDGPSSSEAAAAAAAADSADCATTTTTKRTLVSANVGDSRAILSRRGRAVDLTVDHKPGDKRERERIEKMGEPLQCDDASCKVLRVRNLLLSRSIGDRYAKPVVSDQVEIDRFDVDTSTDEFFLLASDGLWDVMSSQDVVSYVHNLMKVELGSTKRRWLTSEESQRQELRKNMAKFVAREALRKGSRDNISVLIVWLDNSSTSS